MDKTTSESRAEQVSFSVEPGTKVRITLDVGDEIIDGKVPVTVFIERIGRDATPVVHIVPREEKSVSETVVPLVTPASPRVELDDLKSRLGAYPLASWLFLFALAVYLLTRLIGLTQFPIYFFSDEAIQSQSIVDLMNHEYKDPLEAWLPTYFRNGDYYNLSISVYLQWLPAVLFGKSAVATRATSVLVTLIAAVSLGLILRDIFRLKYWWTGTLLLSITPAWFLHSRTAFETAEFVSFYAGTLCAYLLYRHKSARYLYLTILLAALSFYTYSPAQVIVPLTALALLISDWSYHWENRRILLKGLLLTLILALPYIRFNINNPNVAVSHLHDLWSYWLEDIPLSKKIAHYVSEFGIGLSPWYWYAPNNWDLSRHLMKDYGNIMIATLPFAILGMVQVLRNIHIPAYRAVLIGLVVSPAAAALVQISITRTLVFVIPAAILTALGLELILGWLEEPRTYLARLADAPEATPVRTTAALMILVLGIVTAAFLQETINRVVLVAFVVILSLQISGASRWLARSIIYRLDPARSSRWRLSHVPIALLVFITLAGANIYMLNDSLRNGPLWFRDYGRSGMQYGAFQIFDIIDEYLREHPGTKVIFSPDWANGAEVVARFFLNDFNVIEVGSVQGHITQKLPLDEQTLFIITPPEYDIIEESPKFADINVEKIIPYPDGQPGFYFVRLRYADNIDELFAQEKAVRQALRQSTLTIDGQEVNVRHSYLDAESQEKWIALVFDNDPFTVTKTLESNPFVIELTFPKTRSLRGFSIIIGEANVEITVKSYSTPENEPTTYTFAGQGTREQPELSWDFPKPIRAQVVRFEVLIPSASDQAKIHIWELKLH